MTNFRQYEVDHYRAHRIKLIARDQTQTFPEAGASAAADSLTL